MLLAIPGVFDNQLDLVFVPTHSLFVYENCHVGAYFTVFVPGVIFYFLADVLMYRLVSVTNLMHNSFIL